MDVLYIPLLTDRCRRLVTKVISGGKSRTRANLSSNVCSLLSLATDFGTFFTPVRDKSRRCRLNKPVMASGRNDLREGVSEAQDP